MEVEITWTQIAQKQLKIAYDFIGLDSEINAIKVAQDIIEIISRTSQNP